MPSDIVEEPEELFATARRSQPLRTYSTRGRKNTLLPSLPALRYQPPPPHPGPRLTTFRVGRAKSWELKQARPRALIEQLRTVQDERLDIKVDHIGPDAARRGGHGSRETTETTKSSVGNDTTSPKPPSSCWASCLSGNAEVLDVDDDDEDPLTLPQSDNHKETNHEQQLSQAKNLRRRPFLLFDKLKNNGYKRLEPKPSVKRTAALSAYQPGDGFSGREARPDGTVFLTRGGKTSVGSLHMGVLDLTQSEPPANQKRIRRRVNMYDNSFAPAATKRARRGGERQASCQPEVLAKTVQPKVKLGSSVLGAATALASVVAVAQSEQIEPPQDDATTEKFPHQHIPEANMPDGFLPPKPDTTVIERSDDSQGKHDRVLKLHGITAAEARQDTCGPRILSTPLRQLRASSESSVPSPPHEPANVAVGPRASGRTLRRFYTQ